MITSAALCLLLETLFQAISSDAMIDQMFTIIVIMFIIAIIFQSAKIGITAFLILLLNILTLSGAIWGLYILSFLIVSAIKFFMMLRKEKISETAKVWIYLI